MSERHDRVLRGFESASLLARSKREERTFRMVWLPVNSNKKNDFSIKMLDRYRTLWYHTIRIKKSYPLSPCRMAVPSHDCGQHSLSALICLCGHFYRNAAANDAYVWIA